MGLLGTGADTQWVQAELDELEKSSIVKVSIISTRDEACELEEMGIAESRSETSLGKSKEGSGIELCKTHSRPNVDTLVKRFVRETAQGSTIVFASGPGALMSSVKASVASCNSGRQVWANPEHKADVGLVYDDRLEW